MIGSFPEIILYMVYIYQYDRTNSIRMKLMMFLITFTVLAFGGIIKNGKIGGVA